MRLIRPDCFYGVCHLSDACNLYLFISGKAKKTQRLGMEKMKRRGYYLKEDSPLYEIMREHCPKTLNYMWNNWKMGLTSMLDEELGPNLAASDIMKEFKYNSS